MSENFGAVDLDHIIFPTIFQIDWIRVYQAPDQINIGCDPPEFPTQAYINQYSEACTLTLFYLPIFTDFTPKILIRISQLGW